MFSLNGEEYIKWHKPVKVQCERCYGECVSRRYKITWVIYNKQNSQERKRSPAFHLGMNDGKKKMLACLDIYPSVQNATPFLGVYLQPVTGIPSLNGKVRFCLNNGNVRADLRMEPDTYQSDRGYGFDFGNGYYAATAKLKLVCTIWLVESRRCPSSVQDRQEIFTSFRQLYASGDYSDVTLKVDGAVLKAHKAILASRSPVFAAMLAAGMSESNTGEIVIEDIEAAVVKSLLCFIYSGQVDDDGDLENVDMAVKLLGAADKYDMGDLKAKCSEALATILDIENCSHLFKMAVLHNVDQLKTDAEIFMRRNMQEVAKTDGWKQLTKSSPDDVIETFVVNKSPVY